MMDLVHDFTRFEDLHQAAGTSPGPWQRRILAELRFALVLSNAGDGRFEKEIASAEDILRQCVAQEGTITNSAAQKAEEALLPAAQAAKAYEFLCVAHAHIDMNWMWGFHETVGAAVDTFRTMLDIMEEYPGFRFSQSQASVYRILERFAPDMLEEVRARVKEGRWEVTASTWVESDKNLPSGESLTRQYLLAKRYLCGLLDLSPEDLCIDFEPDTFGHNANVPEIASHAGVKYYYHCRGCTPEDIISRWRAPSGAELLVFTEPDWYNADIGYHLAEQAVELEKRTGSSTLLKVYGVGDHGGGPTRRDLDVFLEMDGWPVYPRFRFATLREYFESLEARRESFPIKDQEINFLMDGCYTTHSRIKAGNRRSERALASSELASVMADAYAKAPYPAGLYTDAWEKVLFNQFHDIIPGSGVVETTEYASALYQEAGGAAQTGRKLALRAIAAQIDSASLLPESGCRFSRGEGGGAGFDMCGRAQGKTRLYHVFQNQPQDRALPVEFVVWDYEGDESRLAVRDPEGNWLDTQIIDQGESWGHRYARILAKVSVPACGWSTYLVGEKPVEARWNVLNDLRVQAPDSFVLENGRLRAVFSPDDGALVSLVEKEGGTELIPEGKRGRFLFYQESLRKEAVHGNPGMSSWLVGHRREGTPLERIEVRTLPSGPVRGRIEVSGTFGTASTLRAEIYLDQDSSALQFKVDCDWREFGGEPQGVPCLCFVLPEGCSCNAYTFDIPFGFVKREGRAMDLPGSSFVMAGETGRSALILAAKEKYAYRCGDGAMSLVLIRGAYEPDPIPEIGQHQLSFGVICQPGGQDLARYAQAVRDFDDPPYAVSAKPQKGTLPVSQSFLRLEGGTVLLSAVKGGEDPQPGVLYLRLYETGGKDCQAVVRLGAKIASAAFADALEQPEGGEPAFSGNEQRVPVGANQVVNVRVKLADA